MENIDIISYKHDGELHRVWQNVVKLCETDEMAILINNEVKVIDGDGRIWKTREPAVCFFFKKCWFNVISMIRKEKIFFYCNLSSPYIIDQEGLKYIDYDLDVKVFPNGEILELDRDEFEFNTINLHYSDKIIQIINQNMNLLLSKIKAKEVPFNDETVMNYYKYYLEQKNQ